MLLALAVVVHQLAPAQADAARAAGEARAYEQMTAADDAANDAERRRRHDARLFGGLGIGMGAPPPAGFSPLGDVGQSNFVFTPGSIGARRYKD